MYKFKINTFGVIHFSEEPPPTGASYRRGMCGASNYNASYVYIVDDDIPVTCKVCAAKIVSRAIDEEWVDYGVSKWHRELALISKVKQQDIDMDKAEKAWLLRSKDRMTNLTVYDELTPEEALARCEYFKDNPDELDYIKQVVVLKKYKPKRKVILTF